MFFYVFGQASRYMGTMLLTIVKQSVSKKTPVFTKQAAF